MEFIKKISTILVIILLTLNCSKKRQAERQESQDSLNMVLTIYEYQVTKEIAEDSSQEIAEDTMNTVEDTTLKNAISTLNEPVEFEKNYEFRCRRGGTKEFLGKLGFLTTAYLNQFNATYEIQKISGIKRFNNCHPTLRSTINSLEDKKIELISTGKITVSSKNNAITANTSVTIKSENLNLTLTGKTYIKQTYLLFDDDENEIEFDLKFTNLSRTTNCYISNTEENTIDTCTTKNLSGTIQGTVKTLGFTHELNIDLSKK